VGDNRAVIVPLSTASSARYVILRHIYSGILYMQLWDMLVDMV
jgi:hypothetical protein